MLKIKQFEFSLFGVNTYIAYDEDTLDAAVIDPAMSHPNEYKRFDNYIAENHLHVTQIINTHLHLDHCFGIDYVKTKYGTPVKAHHADAMLGGIMKQQYQMFGLPGEPKDVVIDVELKDGDTIDIGNSQLLVMHVPGHSPGGIALYYKEGNIVFTGDTLFKGSIGRTDIYGDPRQLIESIRKKLYRLPNGTVVLPGHNGSSTIGYEKENNPFT